MPKVNAIASEFSARASDAGALDMGIAPGAGTRGARAPSFADLGGLGGRGAAPWERGQGWVGWVAQLSDVRLSWLLSAVLFALTAWPIALTVVPPLQDLPNHLAAITIIQHPERYPGFVFNGFFKTNTALFAWLYFASKLVGLNMAARLFTWLVLAANAFVLPRFVLEMTGSRKKLIVASLFTWPMIHNWFVSMGMLDFALGVPLALLTLMLLERQRKAPTRTRAAAIAGVAVLTWYAHVFALMVVHLLVGLHAATRATWRARFQAAKLIVPLLPSSALVIAALLSHVMEPTGAMHGFVRFTMQIPPWEMLYNLWAEWLWGFTWLSISSFCAAAGLAWIAFTRRRESVTFFEPLAFVVLLVLYASMPYIATNWFHVNSRLIPFLWVAALVRVPERLPRRAVALLTLSAVLYSAGMGIDYVRLEKDRQKFVAGMAAVPQGSTLLPLLFKRQLTSENTRSLLHAWGFYVTEKQTDAPLLFAHSRSFPVMYREPPPPRFNHLVLESFAPSMGSPAWMCGSLRAGGVVVDCQAEWQRAWNEFWRDAVPRYDHVLMWDPTPEVLALVPPAYRVTFTQDQLVIFERIDGHVALGDRVTAPWSPLGDRDGDAPAAR